MFSKKTTNKIFSLALIIFSIFGTGSISTQTRAKTIEKKQAISAIPAIYPRSSWSNATYEKRTKKIWPAEYKDPKVIIIHHTATSYKGTTSKQIKKIYKYHSYTRKWGDIGYNYIIGSDGIIFQGRYGKNGVIGGHAYNSQEKINFNSGSIGIAVLGNYETKKMSSAALDSLERLVGWLAENNNIKVDSKISFHGKNLASGVVGHGNVGDTACPGKNIINSFSTIRTSATNFASSYQNFAYQINGESEKFEISSGKRYSGSTKSNIANITKTQLETYPSDGEMLANFAYPNDTTMKDSENNRRGILENGFLREITDDSVLSSSFDEASFVDISAKKWAIYPVGMEAGFRSGALLKDPEGYFWIISESQKRILNLSEDEKKLIDLTSAHAITKERSEKYSDGEEIKSISDFPTGTIITSDYKKYYFFERGLKRKISKNVFRATFSRKMAIKVSLNFLKSFKTGLNLSFQNGAVVKYRNGYYFIENGARRQFDSKSLALSMGYKNIVKAKKTEMAGIGKVTKIE